MDANFFSPRLSDIAPLSPPGTHGFSTAAGLFRPEQPEVESEGAPSPAAVESIQTDENRNENVHSKVAPSLAAVESTQTDSLAVAETIQTDNNGNEDVDSEVAPRNRSRAWNDFDLVTEDKKTSAKCKHCTRKYSYSSKNRISSLLNHMRKCPRRDGKYSDLFRSLGLLEQQENDGETQTQCLPEQGLANAAVEITQTDDNRNGNGYIDSEVVPPLAAVESTQTDDNEKEKVDSEVEPPLPKPKRARTGLQRKASEVWIYFDEVTEDGILWAKCRHCSKKYKYSSKHGTSNLKNHMATCNASRRNVDKPADEIQTQCPPEQMMSNVAVVPSQTYDNEMLTSEVIGEQREGAIGKFCGQRLATSSKNGRTSHLLSEEKTLSDQEWSWTDMAKMIIRNGDMGSSLVDADLLDCENSSHPNLKLQSHGILRTRILQIYEEEKKKLINAQPSGKSSLSIDILRCGTGAMYCCLTSQFIDDAWQLNKKVLAFKRVEFSICFLKLYQTILSMLADWSILNDKNVCFITGQNTEEADMVVSMVVSEIKSCLVNQDSQPLGSFKCFLDVLNLLVADGLQELHSVICKIKNCIFYVLNLSDNDIEPKLLDYVRSHVKKVTYEDMALSWKFRVQKLKRVLTLQEPFKLLTIIDSDFKKLESNPKKEDWEKAIQIYKCLKELDEALRSLKGGRCLTANVYFPKVCDIHLKLHKWEQNANSGVRSMACKMKVRFEKYWDNTIEGLAIAVILDPRFKFDIVERCFKEIFDDASEQYAKIQHSFQKVYDKYASDSKNSASSSTLWVPDHHFAMLGPLGMPCSPSNNAEDGQKQKSELERYLDEPKFCQVKDFDILGWWRIYTPNYPTLAKMARDFLAIPMSAALSNPSFDDDVKAINAAFKDLDDEIIEALMCTMDWYLEGRDFERFCTDRQKTPGESSERF